MDTVLPYFKRWMKAFPAIESVARSDEKRVLKAWQGLGYYSRARNIHQAAKNIAERYAGKFPESFEDILAIKGIGRYTAGAIASIAFNQDRPIVDGNVLRVLSRIYAIRKPIDVEKNKEIFWKLQESLIPKGQARYFNQAMMELGALVCSPQNPSCAICPVSQYCKANQEKNPENYPVRSRKRKTVKIAASAIVIEREGKYFIRRRPEGKIMGGLWEFPEWKLAKNRSLSLKTIRQKALILATKEFSMNCETIKYLGSIRRNYTYFLEKLDVFTVELPDSAILAPITAWPHVWVSKKEFNKYPFSSAHAKIAGLILQ